MEKKVIINSTMPDYLRLRDKVKTNKSLKIALLSQSVTSIVDEYVKINDEKIWYYKADYMVRQGSSNNLFLQHTDKKGFVFDLQKKKLTTWYNTNLAICVKAILIMCKLLKIDWFIDFYNDERYSQIRKSIFLTKPIIERILAKKITNQKSLFQTFCKIKFKNKIENWKKFRQFLNDYNIDEYVMSNFLFYKLFQVATKPIESYMHYFEHFNNNSNFRLIINYYYLQNKKINMHIWSNNRFKNEIYHIKSMIVNENYNLLNDIDLFPLPKDFKIDCDDYDITFIKTSKELYNICRSLNMNTDDAFKHAFKMQDNGYLYMLAKDDCNKILYRLTLYTINAESDSDSIIQNYHLSIEVIHKIGKSINNIENIVNPYENIIVNALFVHKRNKRRKILNSQYSNSYELEF